MYKGKKVVAFVPARGRSKRLPGKNIRELNGKPMMAWSIEAGCESRYVDDVVVSTESEEIERVATAFGARVPFRRPAALASDEASTIDVLLHGLEYLTAVEGVDVGYVVLLQPTAPLRQSAHIDGAFEVMSEKSGKGMISVCEVAHPVEWTNTLPASGAMDGFFDENVRRRRSQDFPRRYRINGAIYIVDADAMRAQRTIFLDTGMFAYPMPRLSSIDVDTHDDFRIAELLLSDRDGDCKHVQPRQPNLRTV